MGIFLFAAGSWAQPVLVYKNEAELRGGKSLLGYLSEDGVMVAASPLVGVQTEPILGYFSGELFRGRIMRLDNELDVALLRVGEAISAFDLLKIHQAKVAAIKDFLPKNGVSWQAPPTTRILISGPYQIKINGVEVSSEPVTIREFRKTAEANLEIIRLSTSPIWNIQVAVEATPSHLFWKKGDTRSLTQVPQKKLKYSQQFIFSPMREDSKIKIPLELSSLKENLYEWTISIKSKAETWQKKVPIKFE